MLSVVQSVVYMYRSIGRLFGLRHHFNPWRFDSVNDATSWPLPDRMNCCCLNCAVTSLLELRHVDCSAHVEGRVNRLASRVASLGCVADMLSPTANAERASQRMYSACRFRFVVLSCCAMRRAAARRCSIGR